MPKVAIAFQKLQEASHNHILACDETGNLVSFELVAGRQRGITRTVMADADDQSHGEDSYITYRLLPEGVIVKKLLRVRRGKDVWRKLRFEAHEANELLSVLTAYSLQLVNA